VQNDSEKRDAKVRNKDFVLGYRLQRDVATVVRKASKAAGMALFPSHELTDILAIPYFLLVCDFSKLGKEALRTQYGNMAEVNLEDPNFRWILLGKHALKPPRPLLKRAISLDPFDEQNLKVILLRQRASIRRQKQKAKEYDKKLLRLLWSLKLLRTQGLVKKKDLCDRFKVKPRTIERDIGMLQAIGEMIDYDRDAKAYRYTGDTPWPEYMRRSN
jgi:hypothetical protein